MVNIYRSDGESNDWESLTVASHDNGMVSALTDKGGYFVATRSVAAGPVAGNTAVLSFFFKLFAYGLHYIT